MAVPASVRLCMRCLHAHRPPSHPEWPRNGRESSLGVPPEVAAEVAEG